MIFFRKEKINDIFKLPKIKKYMNENKKSPNRVYKDYIKNNIKEHDDVLFVETLKYKEMDKQLENIRPKILEMNKYLIKFDVKNLIPLSSFKNFNAYIKRVKNEHFV